MSIQDEVVVPTEEELKEELLAIADPKEDEIRSSIMEKYGLDEDDNADLIDQLTKDTLAQKKSFGKVVHQKRTWREKAAGVKPEAKEDNKNLSTDEILAQAEARVEKRLTERDLEELDLSDVLKEKVRNLAKTNGISVRQAYADPYIVFLKSQEDADKKLDNATISRKNNGKTVVIDDSKPLNPGDFDMSTPEGRKSWDDAKLKRQK